MWDLCSPTRNQTYIPCIARWILNHWTREVSLKNILKYRPYVRQSHKSLKSKIIEIIQNLFSDHNGMKLEIINKRKFEEFTIMWILRFPVSSDNKEFACNAGDLGSIPGLGRSPTQGRAWQLTPVFLPGESPWTEVPGKLQSMGLQRIRHD